jgi:hypothetical protein
MLLAGIQKKSLDARLRGHDRWISDTHLCTTVVRFTSLLLIKQAISLGAAANPGAVDPVGWVQRSVTHQEEMV